MIGASKHQKQPNQSEITNYNKSVKHSSKIVFWGWSASAPPQVHLLQPLALAAAGRHRGPGRAPWRSWPRCQFKQLRRCKVYFRLIKSLDFSRPSSKMPNIELLSWLAWSYWENPRHQFSQERISIQSLRLSIVSRRTWLTFMSRGPLGYRKSCIWCHKERVLRFGNRQIKRGNQLSNRLSSWRSLFRTTSSRICTTQ